MNLNQHQAKYNQGLAMGMYDYQFNKQAEYNKPAAEKERLEEAGLNPALLYGGGGSAGGQSVAASADGAEAQGISSIAPMGLNIALQAKQMQLAEKLNESQVALNYAQAAKIGGTDIEKTKQETELIKNEIKLKEYQNYLNDLTKEIKIETYVNDEKSGELTFEDLFKNNEKSRMLAEGFELNAKEAEMINKREIQTRLRDDVETIVKGMKAEYEKSSEELRKIKTENDFLNWQIKQEQALSNLLDKLTSGAGDYGKVLGKVVGGIFGKWFGFGHPKSKK